MKKRSVLLSNAAYAALWSLASPEDEDEDQIILRLAGKKHGASSSEGFLDKRFGVHFPEGFVIHRTKAGDRHEAKVVGGLWQLDGGKDRFSSLGQLNAELGVPNESAWISWFFDRNGERTSIMVLRDELEDE